MRRSPTWTKAETKNGRWSPVHRRRSVRCQTLYRMHPRFCGSAEATIGIFGCLASPNGAVWLAAVVGILLQRFSKVVSKYWFMHMFHRQKLLMQIHKMTRDVPSLRLQSCEMTTRFRQIPSTGSDVLHTARMMAALR